MYVSCFNPNYTFVCDVCREIFARKENLRRHIACHHLKIPLHKCYFCSRKFNRRDVLMSHVRTQHCTPPQIYKCDCCMRTFYKKNALLLHFRSMEKIKNRPERKKSLRSHRNKNYRCVICKAMTFCRRADAISHLEVVHGIQLTERYMSFQSVDEFYVWKSGEEDKLTCQYIKIRTEKREGCMIVVYACCRSGCYSSKSEGKRRTLRKGSKKIDGLCPAQIKMCHYLDSSFCDVTYTLTHLGHTICDERDVIHMRQSKTNGYPSAKERTRAAVSERTPISDSKFEKKSPSESNAITNDKRIAIFDSKSERKSDATVVNKKTANPDSNLEKKSVSEKVPRITNANDKESRLTMEKIKVAEEFWSVLENVENLDELNELKQCMETAATNLFSQRQSDETIYLVEEDVTTPMSPEEIIMYI